MIPLADKIPSAEQHWLSESFVDPNGRVFEWRGDIYRTLTPLYAAHWKTWLNQGVIAELVRDRLLVESEWTDFTTESGESVLRHRRVPVVSYCYEWTPDMLRHAALITLELCIRLAEKGLTLQDGHPWNVLFDGTNPVYVDAASIVPARDDVLWAPYQQFCNFFLFPLYLYASGNDRVARWLLRDYLAGVTDEDLLHTLPFSFKARHPRRSLGVVIPKWFSKVFERLPEELQERLLAIPKTIHNGSAQRKLQIKFLDSLRKDIAGLKLTSCNSAWSRYYWTANRDYFHTDLAPAEWQGKYQTVCKLLAEAHPRTVLDVGANTGEYAKLAAGSGARVIACEVDVSAASRCYELARMEKLNILPLAADVFNASPTPGRGGLPSPPATERFRSEFVMGLAVIHHVVAIQRIPIERIVKIFASLSERWLLLEYAVPLKPKVGASPVANLDDFTVETVESSLKHYFHTVRRFPSYPRERALFLCEKRENP